jgi:prophage regulatory protein
VALILPMRGGLDRRVRPSLERRTRSPITDGTLLTLLLTIDNSNLKSCMAETLVGAKEVAQLLGVSRQRVNQIVQTHRKFPRPVGWLAAGRVWRRREVLKWARSTGRRIRLQKAG